MLHDEFLYDELDPDFCSRIFMGRQKLVSSIESPTLLPEHELNARSLLNEAQMKKIANIRTRRLEPVINRFIPD
ncbi:MAG: hypothetical protein KDK30_09270 [Leptospiraceae bacterium]|nr:hypothetical protein [Leptospiraceae bacterium]MCB1314543.1 hypothetical protein [Leptospiraceae bacterium]MCB1319261.1 hypothetical protein [Leptospiraceae bacterium]